MINYLRVLISFLKTKIIVGRKYTPPFGHEKPANNQDFIYKIKFGDLLKDSGDILLCPVSTNFKPSNPFARKVLQIEGKFLSRKLQKIYEFDSLENSLKNKVDKLGFTINAGAYIGSEHVAFMPCKKLKYRGILFVSVDFYSDDREEINAKRIAEALEVAAKYNCKKLSCPRNFLYGINRYQTGLLGLEQELTEVIEKVSADVKINFVIEYVIRKTLFTFNEFIDSIVYYDFSNALVEYLPNCSEILPSYRHDIKKIQTIYPLNNSQARLIRRILTPDSMNKKRLFRAFKKLRKTMGDYYESSVEYSNSGFAFYLLGLCNEMPWMFNELLVCIKEFYKTIDYESWIDEFIFKERFRDVEKFNKILLKKEKQ